MNLNTLHSIYFLGIGGIGMSAQARYFRHRGIRVAGYDRAGTPFIQQLMQEGIPIHDTEDISQLPSDIDLVIYTPAIPPDHREFVFLKEKGYPMMKRAEVLGELTRGKFTIAVAGTHGKTTITSMITHILKTASLRMNAFIGGISRNYGSNLVDDNDPDVMIVEADEFDRSFLHLSPNIAVISAMDADHLDVYGSHENMVASYKEFASRVKSGGHLVINHSIRDYFPQGERIRTVSVSAPEADVWATNARFVGGRQYLDIRFPDKRLSALHVGVPGRFNVENALTAVAASSLAGIGEQAFRQALGSFAGVERRFDFRVVTDQVVYIDDYAHHPREITACINAARDLYPGRRITGIFQPHLFSRTRDFLPDFALSLNLLDELILLDIYPAREKPIEGISSHKLLEMIDLKHKCTCTKDDLMEKLASRPLDILLSLGAGDIDQLVKPIELMLKKRYGAV
ncbi:MAG: UDP-N-acetylmuramate--L-alanine ligase [Bacteroidales bacterium]|nr:UDP-N-acetylmuramate--L-alanine ligase [Bacteroidales bacterium]